MKKKVSSKSAANIFIVLAIAAFFGGVAGGAGAVNAQEQEPSPPRQQQRSDYVISAKAGDINVATGDVRMTRKGASEPRSASTRDALESGDRLQTGAGGRAEILLNPGSYLRLAENSELELTDASLDSLRVTLRAGVAIIEVAGADETLAPVEVKTPNASILIERKGLYHVETRTPDGATAVRVRKGRARVNGEEIKDGKEITINRDRTASVAKFDKNEQDAFALWSASRAETLAAANRKLSRQTVSGLYSSYRNDPLRRRGGFGGYWLYDPFFGGRTFLPFYAGWSSPYGHGYHRGFGFSHSGFGTFGQPRFGTGIGIGAGGHLRTIHHRSTHQRNGRRH